MTIISVPSSSNSSHKAFISNCADRLSSLGCSGFLATSGALGDSGLKELSALASELPFVSVCDELSAPLELDDSPPPSCLEDSDSTDPRQEGGSGRGSNLTASKRERVAVVVPTTQAVETE